MVSDKPQPALLFMPDISGFTQFVTETEILHSQHIIRELLEILIDSNLLNLQVSEVEGDAIFFYRYGNKPDLQSLLLQVEKMFTRFHTHIKLYEHQRICPCGACKSAVDLSLKIIVHFGEVTGIAVKEYKKLFGRDVILLHRLLKNNLDNKEYVLLTDKLIGEIAELNLPSWYMPRQAREQYDTGEIQFHFSDLSDLHKTVRVNLPTYNSASKTYVAFTEEEIIPAPMEAIFETLLGLQMQSTSKHGEPKTGTILKIGDKHPCLITRNNNKNITESLKVEPENIEMVEMSEKGVAGYRYILNKISAGKTKLSIQMLIRDNLFFRIGFLMGIRSKMMKRIRNFFSYLRVTLKNASFEISL